MLDRTILVNLNKYLLLKYAYMHIAFYSTVIITHVVLYGTYIHILHTFMCTHTVHMI